MPTADLLSQSGRDAAIRACLPLLATYFQKTGSPDSLATQQVVGSGDAEDFEVDDLAWAVRLRVALGFARRLEDIIRGIAAHPSFRYHQVEEETVGAVRGRLDLERYLHQRARRNVPRRYPVKVVERSLGTPENALLLWCVGTVAHSLREAPLAALPPKGPEVQYLSDSLSEFSRLLGNPKFASALEHAADTDRRGDPARLIGHVEERLDGARVANVHAYRALTRLAWDIVAPLSGAGAEQEWLGYDERFDTTLYEIWTLQETYASLVRRFSEPSTGLRSLAEPHDAVAEWAWGAVTMTLAFQPSLKALSKSDPRWRYVTGAQRPFQGTPDVACVVDAGLAGRVPIIIDAKLRQRKGPPAEEMYKVLGYFENLGDLPLKYGAIVFYAPGAPRHHRIEADGGVVEAIGVDPAMQAETRHEFDRLTDLIEAAGLAVEPDFRDLTADVAVAGEGAIHARQESELARLRDLAANLPQGRLVAQQTQLATLLGDNWDRLPGEVQRMLATATYFGFNSDPDFDHRGPLLGLCAACEYLIAERVMQPLQDHLGNKRVRFTTIGAAAHWTREANDATSSDGRDARSWFLDADRPFDGRAFLDLEGLLENVKTFRNDAAHFALIDAKRFADGYRAVMDPSKGLLAALVVALAV